MGAGRGGGGRGRTEQKPGDHLEKILRSSR